MEYLNDQTEARDYKGAWHTMDQNTEDSKRCPPSDKSDLSPVNLSDSTATHKFSPNPTASQKTWEK